MNVEQIKQILSSKSGVTFGSIVTRTPVKTAAKHKEVVIEKTTKANVRLYTKLNDFSVYKKSVQRSAAKISDNQPDNVADFQQQETYYEHDSDCFAIARHKKSGKPYLYVIYNHANSEFTINGNPASRKEVANYLTPSEAKKLLSTDDLVYNASNDLVHDVHVRVISIENVISMEA